ncbi:DUF4373 domain-containing protein [Companilactobacillus baiquanensis]|uniref:DUF4373 domain-containing protein n=1 Tax=Companilactobacillus baiquanensis TaxID=2486005 RepID=A0ABW1UX40_9LACO|nr:DUF4373 domain-containing protein [Companilactobacillus baiquanensis]
MARPIKSGLDYFPFDVDFINNEKVEALMGEFGSKGVLMLVYLLSAVYKKGYYLQWNKLSEMQLVNKIDGLSSTMADQIVTRLIDYGTFDKELFNSVRVLTSQRIQETYLDATKRRKQQKPTLYWINVANNSDSKGVNVNINTQSKVNKSKVNKSNKDSHDSKPAKSVYDPDDINLKLANYLLTKIRERNSSIYPTDSKNPPDTQKWANDIRLMHERDARSYDDIKRIIEWCQQDSFWQNNILSASKLRKQFGKLIDKADAPNNFNGNKGGRKPLYDLPY